ncbi:MAG TPA: aldo/keto reductase [Rhizobiaceae bacterium]|nr:aldo/keto reductase [Rhizobiaceae bacterium]
MKVVEANGARIPAPGMGTWTLRGRQCSDLVTEALDIGYRHVDTAASYENEEDVGAGLRASGVPRDEVFVTTKVWWTDLEPARLEKSAEASLRRLGLDHVDLLLIHWPNPQVPVARSIAALNKVKARGLARNIGVSNFPTGLLAEAIAASEAPLAVNQVESHPYLDQAKVHAACRKAGMAMVAYCPIFRGGSLFREPAIADAARRHDRTPAQVVLRWHLQTDGVVPIPRTTRKERLAENLAIFDFALSDEEMRAISSLTRANKRLCDFGFSPRWD